MRFTDDGRACDDAGRRGCDDVPPSSGAGVAFGAGGSITGDRFDAGLKFDVGSRGWHDVALSSFSGSTGGDYALMIVGELPPRDFE